MSELTSAASPAAALAGSVPVTRFVVCGEALIDLVSHPAQTDDTFASSWSALSAGGPLNSAVALSRLGADSHFLGRLSRDSFGTQLANHLSAAGVQLDLATVASQPTSIAVVSLDETGIPSYTFHFQTTANFGWQPEDLPNLTGSDWLHIASLSCVVSPGAEVLLDWVHDTKAGLSYDINVRPSVITDAGDYWEKVKPWLRVVGQHHGIVKASDEDIAFLAAAGRGGTDPLEILTGWTRRYGFSLGLLTLGPGGAVAVEPNGRSTTVAGFPTQVVDTVGAGDTFMAGFLDSHIGGGHDITTALTHGVAAASIVCSRRGPQPPSGDEVRALIAAFDR